jgi:hypothetical protein
MISGWLLTSVTVVTVRPFGLGLPLRVGQATRFADVETMTVTVSIRVKDNQYHPGALEAIGHQERILRTEKAALEFSHDASKNTHAETRSQANGTPGHAADGKFDKAIGKFHFLGNEAPQPLDICSAF